MKKKTVLALLLVMSLMLVMTGCGGSSNTSGSDAQSTETAGSSISFQTTDLDGNTVDSETLFSQNKITMINIWGTYCGPCVDEMPELEEISKEYAEKDVAVVGVVVDVTESDDSVLSEAQDIVRDTGVTYLNIKAWDGFKNQLSALATPTTYFVDSQGNLVGKPVVGTNVAKYRQTLDELIAE